MSKIRSANLSDDEQITAVINTAFKIVEEFFVDGNRISRAEVRQHMETGFFLVTETENRITGCVYLEPRGERAYLGLLSVDPTIQQGGLGSQLLSAGEDFCRERGARFMDILIVNLRVDLPAFYSKRGYVANGTTPFPPEVPTKQPCHFINMSKPL